MKKQLAIISLLLVAAIAFTQCKDKKPEGEETASKGKIKPVPLPDPKIPGFKFPEDSNTINQWIATEDETAMARHSWGLWTALTMPSGEKQGYDEELLVFETWMTPTDMQNATRKVLAGENLLMEKEERGKLTKPHQLAHVHKPMLTSPNDTNRQIGIVVTVRYDPNAAKFAIANKLLLQSTLDKMLADGKTDIPDFPNTAITLKPTYEILTQDTLDKNGGYYKLNVWGGAPKEDSSYGYGEGSWKGFIYVDPKNNSQGDGSLDVGSGRTPGNTYNVKDFIHYKLTKKEADALNAEDQTYDVKAGDFVILVAMHVTTKEIKRWTWQTYWWAPNADNPDDPSSAAIAALRPAELKGAARHYGMSYAYTFIYPNQPYVGGTNVGRSIYAYNPYLEASFSYGLVDSALTLQGVVMTDGKRVLNNSGVRTNCMTCHAHADYPVPGAPDYQGDTYVSMDDTIFNKKLKVDFAWSIPFNLITK
jgi:hypothetical protein